MYDIVELPPIARLLNNDLYYTTVTEHHARLLVAVVVEFVVAGEREEHAEAGAEREEDL